jgi:polysaccharide biosynthesis transport protein
MSTVFSGELLPNEDDSQGIHANKQRLPLDSEVIPSNSEAEGGLDFSQVLGAFRRRIGIILAVNILVIAGTVAWSRQKTPQYEGSFRILIEPVTAEGQVVSAVTGNQKAGDDQEVGNAQSSKMNLDYPTQIQLLLSKKILSPIVEKLNPTYPEFSYDALKTSLNINRLKTTEDTKILEIKYISASSNQTKQVLDSVSGAYIKYSLSERKTNVSRAIKFIDDQLPKSQAYVRNLEKQLQVFREQYSITDPKVLADQLSNRINITNQEKQTTKIELDKTKQLYRSLSQQLQLQTKSAEAAAVLSDAPGYQKLAKELQDIDLELQKLSVDFTDENPKIISLRGKRERLIPLMKEQAETLLGSTLSQTVPNSQSLPYQNALRQDLSKQYLAAETQVQVLEAKLNGLNAAAQSLSSQTEKLPTISLQYESLDRQLKIATEQVNKFLKKREDLMISAARQEVPWELISSPAVEKIQSPSLTKDLALGSILGLLLGMGVALIVDKMNNVVYSLRDLQYELNFPILGSIPLQAVKQKLLPSKTTSGLLKRSPSQITKTGQYLFDPFLESFRSLNSQIRLLNTVSPIRSIVVSSSSSNEGKSMVAIRLAQAAAAMGQRVLLVNTDLRSNPVERPKSTGLTDIIAGTNKLMDTVQLLPGEENLYILLSGSNFSDPTSILSSQKMLNLMDSCLSNFDLVIYDSPPLYFADSLLLARNTDGLLMVNRLGKVPRSVLQSSLQTLITSRIEVLGLVVNKG